MEEDRNIRQWRLSPVLYQERKCVYKYIVRINKLYNILFEYLAFKIKNLLLPTKYKTMKHNIISKKMHCFFFCFRLKKNEKKRKKNVALHNLRFERKILSPKNRRPPALEHLFMDSTFNLIFLWIESPC